MDWKIDYQGGKEKMLTTDLIDKLHQASKYLNNNGKTVESNKLEDLSKQLQDSNISEEKLEEIKKILLADVM